MKNKKIFNKFLFILLIPITALLFYIASFYPYFIEKIYAHTIYRPIVQILSVVTGFFPFSVAECFVILLICLFMWMLLRTIIKAINNKHQRKSTVLNFIGNMIVFSSITYFLFIMIWGFNYCRLPFSEIANLEVKPASIEELENLCEHLIQKANTLRDQVVENKDGVMTLPKGTSDVFLRASKGYEKAANIYPELGGNYGKPKGIIFSHIMSYTGIAGIYCPFTGEANVNISISNSSIPSTTCHEMAHQRGFSREDEANYIAYLTCTMHSDVDFQYSGTLLALIHSMNALYRINHEKYFKLKEKYNGGLRRDLAYMRSFWQQYEGPVERASTKLNNTYLKANHQKDGVRSYGRMVDLLIAENRLKMSK
ncbi:DUF3810 domain-containing protein [Crassaminicella profunda]|uniref:DUF3810 domain-containing protein n=1 Tax=Crassaminicella profunda TaxID=1286698 RepID=UPI001CA7211E|nr:DUF3810 domain-containing protein [Crassaminicella profunda]QZY57268.1 DUF3810 domain-containing protein [Crassaminicella profunda]